jgi:putative peptidoglycan lipid II flippase
MGAVTAVSRAFGFVRVLVVAGVLGATYLGNTFQAANSMSNVLFELLAAGALSAVLVPTFVALVDGDRVDEANRLAGAVLGVALIGLGAVVVVGLVAAPLIARLLSTGVDDPRIAASQRDLATFLLYFFIPQVLLYAFGAVATALLYARRRFAITAAAPIGNTVVMVAALLAFRALAGPDPGFDLSTTEKLVLAAAGTGGVLAFVGVLVVAARRNGFRLRPRLARGDAAVGRLLRLSGWGVLLHAIAGALLGAALVLGNGVEGGVVAYQVGFVFFLAPYATLAQPIHTAVLPELSNSAARQEPDEFSQSLRWALDSMALLVVPVSVAMIALAEPAMRAVAFGDIADSGVPLLAAAVGSLAVGLYAYGAFLLLARAFYALHDSRTSAVVAMFSAAAGVAIMVVAAPFTHGSARVTLLGIGHSVAYAIGAVVLGVALARRTGRRTLPARLPVAVLVATPLGIALWLASRAIDPTSRVEAIVTVVVGGIVLFGGYVVGLRAFGVPVRMPRRAPQAVVPSRVP